MKRLDGRIAIITGAYGGIGAAAAVAMAREGAKLCIHIHSERRMEAAEELVKKCEAEGGEAFIFAGDLTDPEVCRAMCKATADKFGGIDILVTNAGVLVQGRLQDTSYEDIFKMINVDFLAVVACIKEAYPYLVKSKYGRIVNVTSQLGLKGGAEVSIYAAAKAAVIGLTKSLAYEYGAQGENNKILVNAIAPGPIECGVTASTSEEWHKAKEAGLPLGRYGEAEEVAPGIVFLSSDDCVLFYGQTLGATCGDVMY